jgi:hypothetical protein
MNKLLTCSKRFIKNNSATILTVAGAVGVVTTTVSAVKATPKVLSLLDEVKKEKGEELTKLETVKIAAPAYIPAFISGAATIACIFGANIINKRTQASLMSAYALLDNSYKEYKQKVNDIYGEDVDKKIKQEIAKDHYDEKITVDKDKQLFYDFFSGRYFESTIEDVQRAEYRINRNLAMRDYATLNEFYDLLGLEPIEGGDKLGWSTGMHFEYYWSSWIDFTHELTVLEDGLECYLVIIDHEPLLGWEEY